MPVDLSMETRLDNGMKIYKDKQAAILLAQLIIKYLFISKSEDFI